jgi:hypothetical protein
MIIACIRSLACRGQVFLLAFLLECCCFLDDCKGRTETASLVRLCLYCVCYAVACCCCCLTVTSDVCLCGVVAAVALHQRMNSRQLHLSWQPAGAPLCDQDGLSCLVCMLWCLASTASRGLLAAFGDKSVLSAMFASAALPASID